VVQRGLPIRKAFWQGRTPLGSKQQLRAKLGLDGDTATCVVVGGGDGMGDIVSVSAAVADALGAREGASQLAIVCGRNEVARAELSARAWPSNVAVQVLGFVSEMEQWMGAADVLVTKAGPGTIAEAAAMGLPCVLSSFLPGQEEGNVDFVADAGFGALHEAPAEIGDAVRAWLDDPIMLDRMAAAATKAARPEATSDIAHDLGALLDLSRAARAA
jgi:1,2-diacylglycerol 3-beta-galactosyltransferase